MNITLDDIRKDLKVALENDQNLRYVDVLADTLDDALADAAVQLDTVVSALEYEILERGSNGFLGLLKKNWKIRAYEIAKAAKKVKKDEFEQMFSDDEVVETVEVIDKDGEFMVRKFNTVDDGARICLKVVLPVGNGDAVRFGEVLESVKMPSFLSVDEPAIKKAVESGTDGQYIPVGVFGHEPADDSVIVIDISSDDMHAMATVSKPGPAGADLDLSQIKRALETQGVCIPIPDEPIIEFIDHPKYGEPYEIATAPAPEDGNNAYIEYLFETDRSKLKLKESDKGQVDYKELNTIENVVEEQPLARKIPAGKGKNGKSLKGVFMPAKDGKDINLPLGKNVHVDTDGVTIVASCKGQALLVGDKVSVEPIHEIAGNVCAKTGNINFFGTVIVRGNVEDGYDIIASGNIEISGSVGKCNLKADGDIVINQGIMGGDQGSIIAGGSIWARFIQNTTVDVGEYLMVSDGIVNSEVTCNKKIIITGTKKQAAIKGGHLFAKEAVYTKDIGGSGGGAKTIIEVGVDPKAKIRMVELQQIQDKIQKEMDESELNIEQLENIKKVRKRLPQDKELRLNEEKQKFEGLCAEYETNSKELSDVLEHLRNLKAVGKVSASGMVYSGTQIYVRDVRDEIRNDLKGVTFYLEGTIVQRGKYEPPDEEELKKVPNGYSSN